jgi:hypothetical protein
MAGRYTSAEVRTLPAPGTSISRFENAAVKITSIIRGKKKLKKTASGVLM